MDIQINEKCIVWDGKEVVKCFESEVPKGNFALIKLFWYLATDKKFRCWFTWTMKYALKHAECYRGSGSSDVYLFTQNEHFHKIWKK